MDFLFLAYAQLTGEYLFNYGVGIAALVYAYKTIRRKSK